MPTDKLEELSRERLAYREQLKASARHLVEVLSGMSEVKRISLGGSYAQGRADLFTDLDVLVVMESEEPFVERLGRLYRLLAVPVDMDLVCYTPDEFEALKDRPFLRHFLRHERVLYESEPARGG